MNFERLREPQKLTTESDTVVRPADCPECRSKAVGTLAKIITPSTYWRCETCGAIWNQSRYRKAVRPW